MTDKTTVPGGSTVAVREPFEQLAALPDVARDVLASGPLPEPFCCVCVALKAAEEWLNGDEASARVEREDGFVDRWLAANHAVIKLRYWHDPGGHDNGYWKGLTGALDDFLGGSDARARFFETDGRGHRAVNTIAGDLTWPRCLLLYVLAGWSPDA